MGNVICGSDRSFFLCCLVIANAASLRMWVREIREVLQRGWGQKGRCVCTDEWLCILCARSSLSRCYETSPELLWCIAPSGASWVEAANIIGSGRALAEHRWRLREGGAGSLVGGQERVTNCECFRVGGCWGREGGGSRSTCWGLFSLPWLSHVPHTNTATQCFGQPEFTSSEPSPLGLRGVCSALLSLSSPLSLPSFTFSPQSPRAETLMKTNVRNQFEASSFHLAGARLCTSISTPAGGELL